MPVITAGRTSQWLGEALRGRRPAAAGGGPARMRGSAGDILVRRGAVREFSADQVPASAVQAVIEAARDAEAATWPAHAHGAVTFEILLAAFHVGGLARGLYPALGCCDLAGPDAAWLDSMRGQYADAPVLLLICGDLNHACRVAGPAGYPAALVRAGTIGHAAWLAAITGGLDGSVYGDTSHQVTAAARLLNTNLRHLCTVAMGTPARRDPAARP